MTEYLTEAEQIEAIKNWLKQYGLAIIAGIAIAFVGVWGFRFWQARQAKILSHASSVYDEMLTLAAQNNMPAVAIQARKIVRHYPKTVYGQIAVLMLAREAVIEKNYPEAEKQLQWILDHSNIPALRQIARIRLAQIFIMTKKPQESLALLKKVDDKTFLGLINEVSGDAYLAMENKEKARTMYQEALLNLPNAQTARPLLQMKYDNLIPSPT